MQMIIAERRLVQNAAVLLRNSANGQTAPAKTVLAQIT